MKTNLNIFLLAVVLLGTQACGSKSEKSNETEVVAESPEGVTTLTPAERRAKMDELTAARAERRRIAFEEMCKTTPSYKDARGHLVYNKVDVAPVYVGGDEAMMKYLKENIVFPKDAEDKGLEGTVFVDFIVLEDGSVLEVSVEDAPGEEVDQSFRDEAIRVVNSMPKWTPGQQNGKPVDVKFSLPVTFQII